MNQQTQALNYATSIFVRRMFLPSSGSTEVLQPNPKRIGFYISGGSVDQSYSWQQDPVIGSSGINFFGGLTYTFYGSYYLFGTAITQPLYGIAGGEGADIEVTEILWDGPGGVMELAKRMG